MASTRIQTFTILSTGEGRLDYSQNIQKTVEPTISSWQEPYYDNVQFALGIGGVSTFEISVEPSFMLMLYDFYLSCNPASDIFLQVEYLTLNSIYSAMVQELSNQVIDVVFEKGFPFTNVYRVTAMNLGLGAIDCYYMTHGIKTLRAELLTPTYHAAITNDFTYVPVVTP